MIDDNIEPAGKGNNFMAGFILILYLGLIYNLVNFLTELDSD